jgi:hypothetical protein
MSTNTVAEAATVEISMDRKAGAILQVQLHRFMITFPFYR